MPTLYARHEPPHQRVAVMVYSEREALNRVAKFYHAGSMSRSKHVMVNCACYDLEWIQPGDFQSPVLPTPFDDLYEEHHA